MKNKHSLFFSVLTLMMATPLLLKWLLNFNSFGYEGIILKHLRNI